MRRLSILLVGFFIFQIVAIRADTLKVAYTGAAPFVIVEENQLTGVSSWLWKACAKELNLDFQFVEMPFGAMLDSVETGAVDVSINPLTVTGKRAVKFDFTYPFFASNSTIVKPSLSAFRKFMDFLKSFFSINFLSGFLLLIGFISIFGFLEWYFEKGENPQQFRRGWKGVWDGLWWSTVTMTTVGYGDKAPKTRGGKIVALFWMFSGLLFISGLTAGVASSLTVERLTAEKFELTDFKESSVGTVKRSSTEQSLRGRFFKNVLTFPNVASGLDALEKGEVEAFIYDEPILRHRIKNDTRYQNLQVLPVKFDAQFYAFGISKKRRGLRDSLSVKILEITERQEWQQVLAEFGCREE